MWNNPFKKKEIKPSDDIVQSQLEFTKKIAVLMEKYNQAFVGYQEIIDKQKGLIELYKQTLSVIKDKKIVVPKPDFLNDNPAYAPRVTIATISGEKMVALRPEDIYTSAKIIIDIVNDKGWRVLYLSDKKKCAQEIWKYVCDCLTYEYDKDEDWRFSPVTLKLGRGDCEDGTILFLDLARESGFGPDEVFNATGWVTVNEDTKYGHSFPILKYGEGWKIYETTLPRVVSAPKTFKGSKYDCSWGLGNWYFSGKLKSGEMQI